MSILQIPTARAFVPLLQPARYKAGFGGRGSGKSHFFGERLIDLAYGDPIRAVCIRQVQNTIKDSVKQLLSDKISALGVEHAFKQTDTEITGHNGSQIIFKGMQHYNAESIKSLEGYDIAWVEEAQTLSQRSLDMLRPTIRKDGSELWFSWNPTDELDPVDRFFRGPNPPADSVIVEANWQDNPWFPDVLRKDMEADYARDPAKAAHVWGGAYQQAPAGAYYADLLGKALHDGRITEVPHDPKLETHVSFDLGNGPNMSLWFSQWVNRQVMVIDYLQGTDEATQEGWPWYVRKLKEKPYIYAPLILPHDARPSQRTSGKGDEQTLLEYGFKTVIVPRMDPGERVKLVQSFLPLCWFDAVKTAPGLKALRHYQANYDEKLRVDRGPLHDWSSHPADAFGHLAQAYNAPKEEKKTKRRHYRSGGWMR